MSIIIVITQNKSASFYTNLLRKSVLVNHTFG
jgi:hypothetical protein